MSSHSRTGRASGAGTKVRLAIRSRRLAGQALCPLDLMTSQNSNWLTATEAASYLKVEPRTLLAWVRQGRVKGVALSGTRRITWRFRAQDLDAVLMEGPVLPYTSPSVTLTKGRLQ